MDQEEVRRTALADDARVRLGQRLAAAPGDRGQGLDRIQASRDEGLELPADVVGARRSPAPRFDVMINIAL